MSGYDLKLNDKEARQALRNLMAAGGDLSRPMATISQKLLNSVRKNFREGGRYSRADSIIGGSTKWQDPVDPPSNGSTLYRSGHLYQSIMPESDSDTATLSTNVEYAALHNFGGERTSYARSELFTRNRDATTKKFAKGTTSGKGHTIGEHTVTTPARPFMVVQESDIEDAKIILKRFLLAEVK